MRIDARTLGPVFAGQLVLAFALAQPVAGCVGDDVAPGNPDDSGARDAAPSTHDARATEAADASDSQTPSDAQTPPPIAYDRKLAMPGIADPDVLKENDDLFFLSGTGSGVALPIFESVDLVTFTHKRDYSPSAADPGADYCNVWAPDLTKKNGVYDLYFSAVRVAKGAACPSATGEVTTFHATAPDAGLAFGVPAEVNPGTTFPRTRVTGGCPAEGCDHVVRIDSALVHDGVKDWLFYVWFQNGNNISSFALDAPQTVHLVTKATQPYEEQINEGPDVFARNGKYYLFFSHGFFNSQYAMSYFMADSIGDLTRARAVHRHSTPLRNAAGKLVESDGHNSIFERRGQYYNAFHVGEFDGAGAYTGRRSTFVQPIAFRPDGTIHSLNTVDLRWSTLPSTVYSVDVKRRDGTILGPCIAAGLLGSSTATTFTGICPSAGDKVVPKADIASFRLYYSTNGGGFTSSVEVPYDGVSDRLFFDIPNGTTAAVAVQWNEKSTGAGYSLDVQRKNGSWVAPCVGFDALGSAIAHVFTGACTTAKSTEALADIQQIRICSAINGNWAAASCGAVPYDGRRGFVDVPVP